jgi:hypothetical protein
MNIWSDAENKAETLNQRKADEFDALWRCGPRLIPRITGGPCTRMRTTSGTSTVSGRPSARMPCRWNHSMSDTEVSPDANTGYTANQTPDEIDHESHFPVLGSQRQIIAVSEDAQALIDT